MASSQPLLLVEEQEESPVATRHHLPRHRHCVGHAGGADGDDDRVDADEADDDDNFDILDRVTCLICLPILYMIQFGVMTTVVPESSGGLGWSTIIPAVLCYVTSVYLYLKTLRDTTNIRTDSIMYYIPELVIDFVLLLMTFKRVVVAFQLLVACVAMLSTIDIVLILNHIWTTKTKTAKAARVARDKDGADVGQSGCPLEYGQYHKTACIV